MIYMKTHIKYIENKILKNIGMWFKGRSFLNKKSFYHFTACIFTVTLTMAASLGGAVAGQTWKE